MTAMKPQHQLTVKELLNQHRKQQRFSSDVPISTVIDTSLHSFEIHKNGIPIGVRFSNLACAVETADEMIRLYKHTESITIFDSHSDLNYARIAGRWVVVGLELK